MPENAEPYLSEGRDEDRAVAKLRKAILYPQKCRAAIKLLKEKWVGNGKEEGSTGGTGAARLSSGRSKDSPVKQKKTLVNH